MIYFTYYYFLLFIIIILKSNYIKLNQNISIILFISFINFIPLYLINHLILLQFTFWLNFIINFLGYCFYFHYKKDFIFDFDFVNNYHQGLLFLSFENYFNLLLNYEGYNRNFKEDNSLDDGLDQCQKWTLVDKEVIIVEGI